MLNQLLVRSNAAVIGPASPEIDEAERLLRSAGMQIVYARAKGDMPPKTTNRGYLRAVKFKRAPPLSKRSRITDLPHLPGTLWVGCMPRSGKKAVVEGLVIETPVTTVDTWLENDLVEVISYLAVENKLPGWPARDSRVRSADGTWIEVRKTRPVIGQVSYNEEYRCWEVGVQGGWKKLPPWIIGRCANRFPAEAYAGNLHGLTPYEFARYRANEKAHRWQADADKTYETFEEAMWTVLAAPTITLAGIKVADFREAFPTEMGLVFGTTKEVYEGGLWAQRPFVHVYQDEKGWWMELGGCAPDSAALKEFALWAKESGKLVEGDLRAGWGRYGIDVVALPVLEEPKESLTETPEVSAAPPPLVVKEREALSEDNIEEKLAAQTAREVARLSAKPLEEMTREETGYLIIQLEQEEDPDLDRLHELETKAYGISERSMNAYVDRLHEGGEEDAYTRVLMINLVQNEDQVDLAIVEAKLAWAKSQKLPTVRSLASRYGTLRKKLGLMK